MYEGSIKQNIVKTKPFNKWRSNNNNETNASFNHNHILTITIFAEENLHDFQTVLNVQCILYM